MVHKKNKSTPQKKEYLIQAWVSEDLLNQVEKFSLKYGLPKSIIVRQALKLYTYEKEN